MAKPLLTDELWEVIEPLLPEERSKPKGGRPRVDDRAALTGILWEMLPQETGCGSGMTCWRRLEEWHEAGVWERLHRRLLDRLGEAAQPDRLGAGFFGLDKRTRSRGPKNRPNPMDKGKDKGKSGSKRHVVVNR